MKKLIFTCFLLVFLGLGFSSCHHLFSSSKKEEAILSKPGGAEGGNGESFDEAVVITSDRSSDAVSTEYDWLKTHYPGYALVKQTLEYNNGKPYDVFVIKTAGGEKKTIYFDITASYGKF